MRCGSWFGAAVVFLVVLMAGDAAAPAVADAWTPPEPFSVTSANGQWRAEIEPAEGRAPPRVRVFRTPTRQQAWSVPLSNATAPADAYVTNDGTRVVTLDTVGNEGYGDDVVGIYGMTGPLQRYSLEQVLGVPGGAVGFEHPDVRPSLATRLWRSGAEVLLQDPREPGPAVFAVWLPATHVWVAWDLDTGEKYEPGPGLLERLNEALRAKALAHVAARTPWDPLQSPRYWPLEAIAYQRRPRDRPYLERALTDPGFGGGELTMIREGREKRWHLGESPVRREADRLLAEWDRTRVAVGDLGEPIGHRLGAVRGEVRLPKSPRDGVIHIMLIPADGVLKDGTPLPAQRVDVDLAWERPSGKAVPFRLATVTPGRYRLLALWGTRPANEEFALFNAERGEWLAIGPVVEVRAGEITEAPSFGSGRSATPRP